MNLRVVSNWFDPSWDPAGIEYRQQDWHLVWRYEMPSLKDLDTRYYYLAPPRPYQLSKHGIHMHWYLPMDSGPSYECICIIRWITDSVGVKGSAINRHAGCSWRRCSRCRSRWLATNVCLTAGLVSTSHDLYWQSLVMREYPHGTQIAPSSSVLKKGRWGYKSRFPCSWVQFWFSSIIE